MTEPIDTVVQRLVDDRTVGSVLQRDLGVASQAKVVGLDSAAGLTALRSAMLGHTASTAVVGSALGAAAAAKWIVGLSVLAGLAGWWGLRGNTPITVATVDMHGVAVSTGDAEPETSPEPELREPAASPEPAAELVPQDPPAAEAPEQVAGPAAEGPTESPTEGAVGPAAPAVDRARTRRSEPRPDDEAGDDAVLREAKLIASARAALAKSPAQALDLVAQAKRQFPVGLLIEERKALQIRALAALGRLDEAQQQSESFLAHYGKGAHAASVRRAIEQAREASDPAVQADE